MENNIFIKLKKEKFNPDIELKLKDKETERVTTKINMTNSIYNPITGVIPSQVKTVNDLILQKENSITPVDIKKLILEKENERLNQDTLFKPIKTKVINNTPLVSTTQISNTIQSNTKQSSQPQNNRTNYIETFENLKNVSSKPSDKTNNVSKNNYNNILDGLKDLGIIK